MFLFSIKQIISTYLIDCVILDRWFRKIGFFCSIILLNYKNKWIIFNLIYQLLNNFYVLFEAMNYKNIELSHQTFKLIFLKIPMCICHRNKFCVCKIKVERYFNLTMICKRGFASMLFKVSIHNAVDYSCTPF